MTNAQRDAAALTDWVTATLDRGLGSERQGERPHLDMIATLRTSLPGSGPRSWTAPAARPWPRPRAHRPPPRLRRGHPPGPGRRAVPATPRPGTWSGSGPRRCSSPGSGCWTTAAPTASCRPDSDGRWRSATAAARSRAATDRPATPRPTTSGTGSRAVTPPCRTPCCSAPAITTTSTKVAGPSRSGPARATPSPGAGHSPDPTDPGPEDGPARRHHHDRDHGLDRLDHRGRGALETRGSRQARPPGGAARCTGGLDRLDHRGARSARTRRSRQARLSS